MQRINFSENKNSRNLQSSIQSKKYTHTCWKCKGVEGFDVSAKLGLSKKRKLNFTKVHNVFDLSMEIFGYSLSKIVVVKHILASPFSIIESIAGNCQIVKSEYANIPTINYTCNVYIANHQVSILGYKIRA